MCSARDHHCPWGAAAQVLHGGGPPGLHQHEHLPGQPGPLVLAEDQVSQPVFRIRIQHFTRLNTNRDPVSDPDLGFWWPKIEKNLQLKINLIFFWVNIAIYLSLGLHKGRPSYRRRRTTSTSKHEIFLFLWVIFAFLDPDPISNPDPDSLTWLNPDIIWIWIRKHW